jgi:hypothetical protein
VPRASDPVLVGQACTEGAQLPDGYDECEARAACVAGVCREICSLFPDSCSAGACTLVPGLLDCLEGGAGVCSTP